MVNEDSWLSTAFDPAIAATPIDCGCIEHELDVPLPPFTAGAPPHIHHLLESGVRRPLRVPRGITVPTPRDSPPDPMLPVPDYRLVCVLPDSGAFNVRWCVFAGYDGWRCSWQATAAQRKGRKIGTQERPLETGYYDLLGVPVTATTDDMKKAYRRLAIKHHPDKNPDDPLAEDRFKSIAIAYQTLSDDALRRKYN